MKKHLLAACSLAAVASMAALAPMSANAASDGLQDGISVRTYDWYSDTESEEFLNYTLEQNQGRHMVTLHFQEESQTKDQSFCIIKLTDEEMIWQNVDSEGDTRHFVNSKFWMNHEE